MRRAVASTLCLILTCAIAGMLAFPAEAETMDFDDFRDAVARVAESGSEELAARLGDVDTVRLPDGDLVNWTSPPLQPGPHLQDHARQLLDSLDALAVQGGETVDPEEARRLAREVLPSEDDGEPNIIERILRWLADRLGGLAESLGLGGGFIQNVIVFVVLAALVAGVIYAIVRIVRGPREKKRKQREESEEPGVITGKTPKKDRTPIDWTEKARDAAQAGRYADALRFLHLAGIIRMGEDGHVQFESSRTNGDYALSVIAIDPDAARILRDLSRGMEAAAFGDWPADAEAYHLASRQWVELDERLTHPAPERR